MNAFSLFRKLQFPILCIYATYLSLVPSPGDVFQSFWDKSLHLVCWWGLCLSLYLALSVKKTIYKAALGLFVYSTAIEGLQHFLPPREFSFADIAANGLGIILALGMIAVFERWLLPRLQPYRKDL